jgi:transposase-like protein
VPINHIQFQRGMSLSDFIAQYGEEEQCIQTLAKLRWPDGFRCPRCTGKAFYRIETAGRPLFQCVSCRHQASLTVGTLLESSKLPLRKWFLAIYIISQAKTGISSLALKRQLGVDYRTAWLMHHKLLHAMSEAESKHTLGGDVVVDDAYLGGEKPGTPGRGSPNKVPFVAAVSLNERGHPIFMKATAIRGFTTQSIASWAKASLTPGCDVLSDGLACFAGVVDADCAHSYVVVGTRKPRDLPQFKWVNTILGNLKTKINGAHKHFDFAKYANRYLGGFAYRFNRRFDLRQLVPTLIKQVVRCSPLPEKVARDGAEVLH